MVIVRDRREVRTRATYRRRYITHCKLLESLDFGSMPTWLAFVAAGVAVTFTWRALIWRAKTGCGAGIERTQIPG